MPTEPKKNAELSIKRRQFVAGTGAALFAVPSIVKAGEAAAKYRVGVIGHTGRGDYGHGLDRVWREIPEAEVVAVADGEPKGLAGAVSRLGDVKGYADYREMLAEVKPDLVAVAPRWLDQHHDMVVAAAEAGVRGIYLEKPMCRNLVEAGRDGCGLREERNEVGNCVPNPLQPEAPRCAATHRRRPRGRPA